jgi:hypothetical protein
VFYAAAVSGVLLLFADFGNGIIWMRSGAEAMSTLWLVWPAVPVLVLLAHVLGPLRLGRNSRIVAAIVAAVLALAVLLSVTGDLLTLSSLTGLLVLLVCIGVAGYLLGRAPRDSPPDA